MKFGSLGVKRSPGFNPNPPFGPILDSTVLHLHEEEPMVLELEKGGFEEKKKIGHKLSFSLLFTQLG